MSRATSSVWPPRPHPILRWDPGRSCSEQATRAELPAPKNPRGPETIRRTPGSVRPREARPSPPNRSLSRSCGDRRPRGVPEQDLSERRTEGERDLRRQLLQALYDVRCTEPHWPSLPLMIIPDLFGCSIDEAAGRYCERPPFRPRRRLKVSRSIAKPPPT